MCAISKCNNSLELFWPKRLDHGEKAGILVLQEDARCLELCRDAAIHH